MSKNIASGLPMRRFLPALIGMILVLTSVQAQEPGPADAVLPRELPALGKWTSSAMAGVYKDLAVPADLVVTGEGQNLPIVPLVTPLPRTTDAGRRFQFVPIDRPKENVVLTFSEIKSTTYWEERVLERHKEFDKAGTKDLASLRGWEWLLRASLLFHEGARLHPVFGPDPWADSGKALAARLVEVRTRIMSALPPAGDKGDGNTFLEASRIWAALAPTDKGLQSAAASLHARVGRDRLKAGAWKEAAETFDWLQRHDPSSVQTKDLAKAMHAELESLLKEAAALPDFQAIAKLQGIVDAWPTAPEAAQMLARKRKTYRVLYVGVRELPKHFSPATARTWEERQFLDLIFAPLTERVWRLEGKEPLLVDVPQQASPLPWPEGDILSIAVRPGRAWSDGRPVTAADVRHTYALLRTTLAPKHPLVRELIEKPRVQNEAYRINLTLQQSLFDPLALTRMPLYPAQTADRKSKALKQLDHPADAEFDTHPTGSGPFMFVGREKEKDGTPVIVLRANPGYPRSANKAGVFLGEIRILAWDDVKAKKRPHLLLQPVTGEAALAKVGYRTPLVTPGKALHYLAVNHRRPALALLETRLALAHAIQRDEILAAAWNDKTKTHAFDAVSASGPIEVGTWPYPPPTQFKANPFPMGSDRIPVRQAVKKIQETLGVKELTLTLLCPANDARAKRASKTMQAQWRAAFSETAVDLRIEVKEMTHEDLHAAVRKGDYDLAWQQLDRPEDIGALWSLLDGEEHPESGNILGFREPALVGLFRKAILRQPFTQVRTAYHKIHMHVYDKMPLLPLWHEAPRLAVHSTLDTGTVDPRNVFRNILEWSVKE